MTADLVSRWETTNERSRRLERLDQHSSICTGNETRRSISTTNAPFEGRQMLRGVSYKVGDSALMMTEMGQPRIASVSNSEPGRRGTRASSWSCGGEDAEQVMRHTWRADGGWWKEEGCRCQGIYPLQSMP
jgi:hypothetical protein